MLESFMANTHTSFNQEEWEFIPNSFKEFLKMLSKTKLKDDNEYDITIVLHSAYEEPFSFDSLLKFFANDMFDVEAPNKKTLIDFYSNAYQLKLEAQNDRQILNMEPEELIGQ